MAGDETCRPAESRPRTSSRSIADSVICTAWNASSAAAPDGAAQQVLDRDREIDPVGADRPERVLARDQRRVQRLDVVAVDAHSRRAGPRSRRGARRRGRRGARARRARSGRRPAPARRRPRAAAGRRRASDRAPPLPARPPSARPVGLEPAPRPRPARAAGPPDPGGTRSPRRRTTPTMPHIDGILGPGSGAGARRIPIGRTDARASRSAAASATDWASASIITRTSGSVPERPHQHPARRRRARASTAAHRGRERGRRADVDPARHPHVHEHLRHPGHLRGERRQRPARAAHESATSRPGQQAVAGRRVLRVDDVARLLAAEHEVVGLHRRDDVAVADRRLDHADARRRAARGAGRGSTSPSPRSRRCAARRARACRSRSSS